MKPENGFGLVASRVTAAIAGMLASIALPTSGGYSIRGKIQKALSNPAARRILFRHNCPLPGGIVQQGMTLIEIMIAIAILGMLLVVGIPSYQGWMRNSQIRTAAESVQNGLQLARAEAAQLNTNVSFILSGNDWSVNASGVAASSVFYTADAGSGVTTLQRRSGMEGTPNAVISAVGATTITFNGIGRITPTPAASQVFTVQDARGGACATTTTPNAMRCLSVVVEAGGKIWMCDPALNGSGNPQACAP